MDFCGWVNSPPVHSQSGVDWDWLSGDSQGQLVPVKDHSTNTALGSSQYLPITDPIVLEFKYHFVSYHCSISMF